MRTLLPIAIVALVLCAAVPACMFFNQANLIYFPNQPGRELTATPRDIGLAFEEFLVKVPDGPSIHGWFIGAAENAPVVMICHGNAGNISHRLDWVQLFHATGFSVVLFDYRGYGRSTGSPSEDGTYRDARAAWDHLTTTRRIPPGQIILLGESLGGPIAAHLAKEVSPAALVLMSTFTSIPDLAKVYYPFLPVKRLARFRYPTLDYVAEVRVPTLIIHSRADEIVPYDHAERLFGNAREPKRFLEVRGSHNTGLLESGDEIASATRELMQEVACARSGTPAGRESCS